MENIKARIFRKNILIPSGGIVLGLAGGFAYYYFVGCQTGTCAITSNPWLSMLWGAAVGYLLSDLFSGKQKGRVKSTEQDHF